MMPRVVYTAHEMAGRRAVVLRHFCIDYLNTSPTSESWLLLVNNIHNAAGRLLDALSDEDDE
jgi:hypothetical protein